MNIDQQKTNTVKNIVLNLETPVSLYYGLDIVTEFSSHIRKLKFDKLYIITEKHIYDLHGKAFVEHIASNNIDHEVLLIPGRERNKSFKRLQILCDSLVEKKISKNSIIVAFGGGIIGNISGMAAAVIYRGVRFVEIPTTFMGQSDSSLSNKQAINGKSGKNQFGTYYAPEFVWADLQYLQTENTRHIRGALVEGVKNAFISNEKLIEVMSRALNKAEISSKELFEIYEIIIKAKNKILAADPTEKNYAIILEYGHTFGHALEFLSDGKIIHGEAVAIGMCIAAELSNFLGYLSASELSIHNEVLLKNLVIDSKIINQLTADKVYRKIQNDNKRISSGVKFILLEKFGRCLNPDGDYQVSIRKDDVMRAIMTVLSRLKTEKKNTIHKLISNKRTYIKRQSVKIKNTIWGK